MNLNKYQALALRTAPEVAPSHDILHAGLGMATEAAEFLDVIKKQHAYGKPLDLVNMKEEVGDILWYLALACRGLGTTLEIEAERNIHKLLTRYPEKFTEGRALNRDLPAERAALEGKGMKKRSYKTKLFAPEIRRFAVKAMRDGYSLNRVVRATGIPERQVVIWRDEEGIKPIPHTSRARQNLPELVFDL